MGLGALTEQWILQAEQSVFWGRCHDVDMTDDNNERLVANCTVVGNN